MGDMMRKLFTPGKGSTLASYTAAVSDGVIYPADWVALSTTVPTSQGASGVFRGQTLGATDYIECTLLDSDNLGSGSLALGVVQGKGLGAVTNWATVTPWVLADGDICVIQNWGVCPQAAQADTGLLGDYIVATTVAGEPLNQVSGTVTNAQLPVGVVLVNSTTYTRATAADTHGSVVFVTCRG